MTVDMRNTITKWIRSSRCGPQANTNCLELGHHPRGVVIRDSKGGDGVLLFADAPWLTFLEHCRSARRGPA